MSYAPYSYSKMSTWKQCPAKFSYQYREKFPVEPGEAPEAVARGLRIHQSIEQYLLHSSDRLDNEIHERWGLFFENLRRDFECTPERAICVTRGWVETDWDHPDAFIRGIMDNIYLHDDLLIIQDWKTGKAYDSHLLQRRLYALLGFLAYPIDKIRVEMVYLDMPREPKRGEDYNRSQLDELISEWVELISQIEQDEAATPMPQFLCRYCQYSTRSGGPCRF